MAQFNREKTELFLGVVRKYMQVRGPMAQKELAEISEVGVSTMSRFLNQKTTELNPQLIAKIVAKLDIPLHEIIDFVEESYSDKFIRLVKFYKDDQPSGAESEEELLSDTGDEFVDGFSSLGTAQKSAAARVSAGGGKTRTLHFDPDSDAPNSSKSIRDKLGSLSPRQKAYLSDFLNLDMEGRDLMVDLGNALVRYIRQKGMDL